MNWTKVDAYFLFALSVLAIFIWLRDTTWMSAPDDTLPILIAIPLFIWLGMPWSFDSNVKKISTLKFVLAIIFFLLGVVLNITLLLAISWTLLLWIWLMARVPDDKQSSLSKLFVLPLMAFPWITLDAQQLGWWFRLSGAWVTAKFYYLMGYEVYEEGTNLLINNIPIAVEAACAGLNTLQSMLIAGTAVAYIMLGHTQRFWWNIPILIGMSWLANTIRIIFLVALALFFSPEAALGSFHIWGGWFILCVMFALCWLIFHLQEPKSLEPLDPNV